MIPISFRNLKPTDRVFIGWDSWNGYSQNLQHYLQQFGCSHVKDGCPNKGYRTNCSKKKHVYALCFCIFRGFLEFFRADAFFFFHGASLFFPVPFRIDLYADWMNRFRFWDLWLFRVFRKKVYLVFQGNDIRDYAIDIPQQQIPRKCYASDAYLRSVYRALPFAEAIVVSTPDLLEHIPKQFRPKAVWVPKLLTLPEIPRVDHFPYALKILHAPSDPVIKGSAYLGTAMQAVRKKYPQLQWIVCTNVPNQQILQTAQSCFCAIDQCIIKNQYGHFPLEMMSLGLPVITFLSMEIKERIQCPILALDPEHLADSIEKHLDFLLVPDHYHHQVQQQYEFLKKYHLHD